jgi:hypothetical protein
MNESAFDPGMAAGVSTYNCLLNTINSLVFVYQVSRGKTNPLASNWMQYVGFAFLLTGTVGEIMIEETRKAFKKNPSNKGRIHDTGEARRIDTSRSLFTNEISLPFQVRSVLSDTPTMHSTPCGESAWPWQL